MFGYTPYQDPFRSSYLRPSSYASDPYYRALAEEQAARDQYAAALRAQEEARERAARARRLREAYRYASPYNSYFDDEDVEPYWASPSPYARAYGGFDPYEIEAERERRRSELLAREREREMQREIERRMLLEEERKRLLEEERRRREIAAAEEERERRRRAEAAAQEFFSNFGRGRMFPDEQAHRDKMGHKRSTSTLPNSETGVPQSNTRARQMPSRSPNPTHRRTASAQPAESTRIPIRTPSPTQPKPPSPKPQYTKAQAAAAEKIQAFVRAHFPRRKALRQISQIEANFDALRTAFSFPAVIDFSLSPSNEEHIVSVSVDTLSPLPPSACDGVPPPNLPYTPHNTALHAYDHELGQILGRLDEVQSGGDVGVRERRKEVVRRVLEEQARVEEWRVGVWGAWVKQSKGAEATTETVDGPSAPQEEIMPEARMEVEEASSVSDRGHSQSAGEQSAPQIEEHSEDRQPELTMEVEEPTTPSQPTAAEEVLTLQVDKSSEDPRSESEMDVEGSVAPAAPVDVHLGESPSDPVSVSPVTQATTPSSIQAGPSDIHVQPAETASTLVTHPIDDGVEVEYIEEAPAMEVDEKEEDLPEPPVKIRVEDADAPVEEMPAGGVEAEGPPESLEESKNADTKMEVDVPEQPGEEHSEPATSDPSQPEATSLAEVVLQLAEDAPQRTSLPTEVEDSASEPETEAPQTPPPPSHAMPGRNDGEKMNETFNADGRTIDEFVML